MAPRKSTAPKPEDPPKHSNVYQALAAAQAEIQDPRKKRTAKVKMKSGGQFEYKYADLSDALAAIRPALSKHGIASLQTTSIADGQMVLNTILIHGDSDTRTEPSTYPVCSIHGDHQQMGAAVSYARRYALCMAVGIAPAEDGDGEVAAPAGDGEIHKMSMLEAKRDVNWKGFEEFVRQAVSHATLDKAEAQVKSYKRQWPKAYVDSAFEEIKNRREEIDEVEKVRSAIADDPAKLVDLLDECTTEPAVTRLVESLQQVTELTDDDFALINERIESLK